MVGRISLLQQRGRELSGRTLLHHPEDKGETPENAFDNDELTYTNVYAWLGKDFETTRKSE